MLKLGRVAQCKMLFLVLVFVFNFDLFKFSAAILEKGLLSGEAAKTSREVARKKTRGLSPTSTTRSDGRFSPLASEKTSGIQGMRQLSVVAILGFQCELSHVAIPLS